MNPSRIQRLHCLTSERSDLGPVDQAERLCSAGARWIQFRMKDTGLDPWIEVAKQVRAVCRRHEATFVVNDSIEVALAVEADGVHLGQEDGSPMEARERLGPAAVVGVTVHNCEEANQAITSGVIDYWGIGPFRRSPTKGDFLPALEAADLDAMLAVAGKVPVVVIGGVTDLDVAGLVGRGAYGVAVCSSLFKGDDLEGNLKVMLTACDKAMEKAA